MIEAVFTWTNIWEFKVFYIPALDIVWLLNSSQLMVCTAISLFLIRISLSDWRNWAFFIGHLYIFFCKEPIYIIFLLIYWLIFFFLDWFRFLLYSAYKGFFLNDYMCCKWPLLSSGLPFSALLRGCSVERQFPILMLFISSVFSFVGSACLYPVQEIVLTQQ